MYFLPPKGKTSSETCTVNLRKFTACILRRTERKLWMHHLLPLVWVLFSWRNKIKDCVCLLMPLGNSNSILCFYLMCTVQFDLLFPKVNSNLISFSIDLILPHVRIFYFQNEWHKRFWNRDSLSSCSQSLWRQEQSFWPPTSRTSVKFDWLLANQI